MNTTLINAGASVSAHADQQGLTQAEIAEKLGLSTPTISRRIEELKLEPIGERKPEGAGRPSPLYSLDDFNNLFQQQQQQMKLIKQEAIIEKQALSLPGAVKEAAMRNTLQGLVDTGDIETIMNSTAIFIAALNQTVSNMRVAAQEANEKLRLKDETIRAYEEKLNEERNWVCLLEIAKQYPDKVKRDRNGKPVSDPNFVKYAKDGQGRKQRKDEQQKFPFFVYHISDVVAYYEK